MGGRYCPCPARIRIPTRNNRRNQPTMNTDNKEIPPQQCHLICEGYCYNDDKPVEVDHILEWRGELTKRYNPDKDDILKLYSKDEKFTSAGHSDIVMLGRTPGVHTVSEMIHNLNHNIKQNFTISKVD